jgi:ABC-type multidrug transport system ATPase subunit
MERLNRDQGTTIVMVTHDSRMASQTQRRLFLSDGKLLAKEREGLLEREVSCPHCQRTVPEDAEYCPRCGNKL